MNFGIKKKPKTTQPAHLGAQNPQTLTPYTRAARKYPSRRLPASLSLLSSPLPTFSPLIPSLLPALTRAHRGSWPADRATQQQPGQATTARCSAATPREPRGLQPPAPSAPLPREHTTRQGPRRRDATARREPDRRDDSSEQCAVHPCDASVSSS
jgi:hypothetical protein